MKLNKYLYLILFVFLFQPPIIPISLIYILGPFVLMLILRYNNKTVGNILYKSKILWLSHFLLILAFYLVLINSLDILIVGDKGILLARLRSFNQLLLLPGIQFILITYLLIIYEKNNYSLFDVVRLLMLAGCVQGLCAIVAFLVPPVRSLFLAMGPETLYTNEWYLERRGYGFSSVLIDTFGFGMGLIAGYIVLYDWRKKIRKIYVVLSLLLILFSIAVNSRTGILVFVIALLIRLLYDRNIFKVLIKLTILTALSGIIISFAQKIAEVGVKSENYTIAWISIAFSQIMDLFSSDGATVDEMVFISEFVDFPHNFFEFLFGSGHWIYDTGKELGFRSDIGWFNLFWEFGVLGTVILITGMICFMIRPFFLSIDDQLRRICLFNTISYLIVLIKAILLGYNPGSFVIYYFTFCSYYLIWKQKETNIKYIN